MSCQVKPRRTRLPSTLTVQILWLSSYSHANVSLHRRRTVREPAAHQVRKQLACSGFAVRWKRLFDAITSMAFLVFAFTPTPSCQREAYASPSRSTTRFLSRAPQISPRQW